MEETKCSILCGKILKLSKQRRVWAAILSIIAIVAESLGYPIVPQVASGIAGALTIHSYVKPKVEQY